MQAKAGDTVLVHYTGTLTTGEIFDSSIERDPLQFTVGQGQVIPGFDNGVEGMAVGEKKIVNIPVEQAYGEYSAENIFPVGLDQFPQDMAMEKGMPLNMQTPEGYVIPVIIHEVKETEILIDANHPLAGQALTFDIELVQIM